jgi:dTDP-4-amino-4,6-dideoxygalactose transaminase
MQAVLGRIQLTRMADWSATRKRNGQQLYAAAAAFDLIRLVNRIPIQ